MNEVVDEICLERDTRKRRRAAIIALLLLGLVIALAWRLWPRHPVAAPVAAIPVDAGTAIVADFPIRVVAVGTVVPLNMTDVKVRVDGQLQRIAFREGQDVKAGELLAQLDQGPLTAQLEQAEATLRKDSATLDNARLDYQRYTKLAPIGAATTQMVDSAKAKVDELQATVAADAAIVRNDRLQLGFTKLVAPFDGRVGAREADVGAIVHTTDTTGIVAVTQMAPIQVQFSVPQDVLPQLVSRDKRGALPVTVTARSGGPALAQGSLVFIDSRVDPASGQVMLKASFPNADRTLWPGQFVDARLLLRTETNRIALPSRAIMNTQDGSQVYVVAANGTAQLRPVKTGVTVDGMTEVTHGVQAGDTVVFDGQSRLNPGVHVMVKTVDAKAAAGTGASAPANTELPS
ncbi:efflux RND transporter periplasmic adaptor subunit [Paraburkholderia sp. SIMBA_054]|uniref:efflux RND transporter periplasmic adaptor subunit n=1 Tax=Paraburkholderia sp. SIMBA_054 TaxID=3085795 RepID=UPI00397BCD36